MVQQQMLLSLNLLLQQLLLQQFLLLLESLSRSKHSETENPLSIDTL